MTTSAQTHQGPLQVAPHSQALTTSATLAMNETVAAKRAAGHTVIHLGFGEAPFPLHPLLKTALDEAATHTSYAPVQGIAPLRRAIADYLSRTRSLSLSAEGVIVAPGSKPLLYALLQVLDGDLLLPVPSWVSYAPQAHMAGKQVLPVDTSPEDHHRLTPDTLADAFSRAKQAGANPRLLLVNMPSNPTGSMLDRADVEAMTTWAREQGITIISDEIYAELAHGWHPHTSPAIFYPEGAIITGGLSKAFSAGGWRLGYAALPAGAAGRQVMAAVRAVASDIWSSATTPVQEAAAVAYSPNAELEQYVQRSARLHGHVTGRLYATLVSLGVRCPRPAGAFYLYPDFAPWRSALAARGIHTSADLARTLLEEWDIATLPGSEFCEQPEALRLRLATSLLHAEDHLSSQERAATLWGLLEQADTLPAEHPAAGTPLKLPMLEQAQVRLSEFVASLGEPR
ncbi:MAG TPA: aminotransferase class I/II-fold pyridoxal phosphate-dependent enzyme [Ktedonobacterales bacterium]